MTVPKSQFHLFWIESNPFLYQTYEEALKVACQEADSAEFVDLDPDSITKATLFFPKSKKKITIYSKLFTYNPELPLIVKAYKYDAKLKTYEFRNLDV